MQVPYFGVVSHVGLAVGDDGYVILVAGFGNYHFAWRINPLGNQPLFAGVRFGSGAVLDAPLAGEHDPLLPVVNQGKLTFESLDRSSFYPGMPCGSM